MNRSRRSRAESSVAIRVARAILRRALALYPSEFRARYGDEVASDFERLLVGAWNRGGALSVFPLLLRCFRDVLFTSFRERFPRSVPPQARAAAGRAGRWDAVLGVFRFAFRTAAARPGFTLMVVLTLGLGIGASTAIYELVHAIWLEPLPYRDAERLVAVWESELDRGGTPNSVAPANFLDWHRVQSSFSGLAAFTHTNMNLTGDGEPERLEVQRVSGSFFRVLGVEAVEGRLFRDEDDGDGAPRVVALSHGFWRRRFGGRSALVGESILLDDRPFEVIGVLPRGFHYPSPSTDVYVPMAMSVDEASQRRSHYLRAVGRLEKARDFESASQEMSAIASNLAREHPESNRDNGVRLVPLREELQGSTRRPVLLLVGAVASLLLIACGNATNLLLARATTRQREVAVRAVLGASRARLVAEFAGESVLLSGIAGGVGVFVFWTARAYLAAFAPQTLMPSSVPVGVLLFGVGLSLLVGVVVGCVAGLQCMLRVSDSPSSETGLRFAIGDRRGGRLRNLLVTVEVAAASLLLCVSALLVQSFRALSAVDLGFRAEGVLAMSVAPSKTRYAEHEQRVELYRDVIERVERQPRVLSAGFVTVLPLTFQGGSVMFEIEGREDIDESERLAVLRSVTPGYFRTMGIPLLAGRGFDGGDDSTSPKVILVNDAWARRHFPDGHSVGSRVSFWGDTFELVGIVGDVRQFAPAEESRPAIYVSANQRSFGFFDPSALVVRTTAEGTDPRPLVPSLRAEIWSLDPDQPVSDARLLEEIIASSLATARSSTWVLTVLAALALLLSAIGIFGVLSYAVGQRTTEMGLRLALGARPSDVLRLVVRAGMRWALLGATAGTIGSVVLGRGFTHMLYQVEPRDPKILAFAATTLLVVALTACLAPAIRAARIEPIVALHDE